MRSTHTFASLAVSRESYQEIRQLLTEAGYQHAFIGAVIDMHGIGLVEDPDPLAAAETEGRITRGTGAEALPTADEVYGILSKGGA